jgi:hypothetical protein
MCGLSGETMDAMTPAMPPQTCWCDHHPEHPCMNSASGEDLRCGDARRNGTCIVVFTDGAALPGEP